MLMKKGDNRGFTLVELIIAISIFSIVIFIGYSIINGTNKSMKENQIVYESQLSINIINKYLSKDLEKSKNLIEDYSRKDSQNEYSYIIETSSFNENNNVINYIKYDIKLNNNETYNVTRTIYSQDPSTNSEEIKGEITIVDKQNIDSNNSKPFIINREIERIDDEGIVSYKNKYEVIVESNSSKTYSFEVTSRIIERDIQSEKPQPEPPIIKPDPPEEINPSNGVGYMGFWIADPKEKPNDNLYVWMNSTVNDEIFDEYGTQQNIDNGVEISGNAMPGNSSGGDNSNIGDDTKLTIDKEDKKNFPNIGKSKFSVYVSEGIIFENEGIKGQSNKVVCNHNLEGMVNHYHSEMETNNNINLTGKMKLLPGYDSGYVIVIYGS